MFVLALEQGPPPLVGALARGAVSITLRHTDFHFRENPLSGSPTPPAPPGAEDVQFDRAEFAPAAAPAGRACVACKQPITGQYFEAAGKLVCANCVQRLQTAPAGSGISRFFRAAVAGTGAATLGAAIFYVVLVITSATWGIISIVVGFLVGNAVRWGAHRRGGIGYQLLAAILTYLSIGAFYTFAAQHELAAHPELHKPDDQQIATEMANATPLQQAVVFVLGSFISPVLLGMDKPIRLIIFAFAIWEAWRLNRRVKFALSGPFSVAPASPAPPPPPTGTPDV